MTGRPYLGGLGYLSGQGPGGSAVPAVAAAAATQQQSFIIGSFGGAIYITNQLDVEDTPLYDTFAPAAGSTMQGGVGANSQLFTNVGFNAGKNYAQTNMQEPQKLPAPEAFSIFGIRLGLE